MDFSYTMSDLVALLKKIGPLALIIVALVYATSDRNMKAKQENPGGRFS